MIDRDRRRFREVATLSIGAAPLGVTADTAAFTPDPAHLPASETPAPFAESRRLTMEGDANHPPHANDRAYLFLIDCPQHITPRFTDVELEEALAPLRQKMQALKAEVTMLRARTD
ncbi:hypothetical protein U1872_03810 [Sphingomonas sp. RB3P16]|uniref:hypothetical protein n=1 Tax=Parasphingomonas frigoris TaxID=3096163 RepID=UPI002FC8CB58